MKLISFIHIPDTERNTTGKYRESCYKKYSVCLWSGNIRITICTRANLTKFYTIFFFKISMKCT